MGMCASAHLAYGYDLGTSESFAAAERDEYDGPDLPWNDTEDFADDVDTQLLESIGFTEQWAPDNVGFFERRRAAGQRIGVEVYHSGHCDYPGWMMIATGSHKSVSWAEATELDLDELADLPAKNGWDRKLAYATDVLGITPMQAAPKWLVFPTYG